MTAYSQDPSSANSSPVESGEPLVVLEFSSFQDFLDSCASRISPEGLFLETEPRERVSSLLRFELRIRDGFRLLRGTGEVIRVHDPLPTSEEPAGLTVRFASLDEASRKLLPIVLDHYHQNGIPMLDLEAEVSAVEVEVTAQESADQKAIEVNLDDLWEEFEVVSGPQTPAPSDSPSADGIVSEPQLIEARDLATAADLQETGEELEAVPAALDEVEPGAETDESVEKVEAEAETADRVEGEEDLEEAQVVTEENRPAAEEESLDLAGVLPTAPGAIASSGDLELPPDELTDYEEVSSSSWQQVREIWLLLVMAFLGILIGFVVYLSYQDGFEWPWSSGSDRGEPASTELLAAYSEEAPENLDIIAVYDFEDPAQVVPRLGDPEPDETAAERVATPKASRKDSTPKKPATQGNRQEKPRIRQDPQLGMTGVDRITWQESQDETVLTLWGDGPFDVDQLIVFRLDTGTPRQVVKILGVSRPCSDRNLVIGTSHVSAVRTGLHSGEMGQELHIVADLEDSEVRMRRVEPEGSQLHVYFSKL